MSKYFSFCNQRSSEYPGQQKNKKKSKQTLIHRINFGLCLRFFLLLVIVCLANGYIFLTNFSTTKGFEIAEIEREMKILQEQNKNLVDNAQELKSLANVEERAGEMGMVSVGAVEYISVSGGVAVVK